MLPYFVGDARYLDGKHILYWARPLFDNMRGIQSRLAHGLGWQEEPVLDGKRQRPFLIGVG